MSSIDELVGKLLMPGDVVFDESLPLNERIIFGPGLKRQDEKVIAVKCGILKRNVSRVYYVEHNQKRYIPIRGENVIGIVAWKTAEEIYVDIGTNENAVIDLLSFEGATKRNKPKIQIGEIIYGKIIVSCKGGEPEIVCVNSYGKSVGFGVLPEGGFVFPVSLGYCRRLLMPNSPVLKKLGKIMPYEIAIGLNGRIWLKANSIDSTLILYQALKNLESATEEQLEMICEGN